MKKRVRSTKEHIVAALAAKLRRIPKKYAGQISFESHNKTAVYLLDCIAFSNGRIRKDDVKQLYSTFRTYTSWRDALCDIEIIRDITVIPKDPRFAAGRRGKLHFDEWIALHNSDIYTVLKAEKNHEKLLREKAEAKLKEIENSLGIKYNVPEMLTMGDIEVTEGLEIKGLTVDKLTQIINDTVEKAVENAVKKVYDTIKPDATKEEIKNHLRLITND